MCYLADLIVLWIFILRLFRMIRSESIQTAQKTYSRAEAA